MTPEDDLQEAPPKANRVQSTYGYVVVSDSSVEILVDRKGQIYKDRVYQGIIPGMRNELYEGQLDSLASRDLVLWVGFQSMAALQRLFFLISDPNPSFEVTRLSERKIEVFFPNFDVPNRNTVRGLWTEHFNGPVHRVLGKKEKQGIRYVIELKTDVVKDITRWRAMPPELADHVIRFYSHYTRKEGPGSANYESELIEALMPAPAPISASCHDDPRAELRPGSGSTRQGLREALDRCSIQ